MKTETLKIWGLSALILFTLFTSGCKKDGSGEAEGLPGDRKPVIVETAELRKTTYQFTISFPGIIKPFDRVDIGFKSSGRVETILFDEGDMLVKGDTLAVLEKDELEAAFRQAQASFDKADSSYKRNLQLLQDGTISPSEIERSEAEYKIKKAALDLSRIQLENATICAPISGRLAFRNIEEKEIALPNRTYFSIMNISDVMLEIGVPANHILKLSPGQKVVAGLESYPNERVLGEIYRVAIAADDFNKLFKVEIKIPNGNEILKPGMIVNAEIEVETFNDVYILPLNVINESDDDKYIFIARGGAAAKKILGDFAIFKDSIILKDRLDAGDRLITRGFRKLDDGVKIYEDTAK